MNYLLRSAVSCWSSRTSGHHGVIQVREYSVGIGRESARIHPHLLAAWQSSAAQHGCVVSGRYLDGGDFLEEVVHTSVLLFIDRRWRGRGATFDVTAAMRWPPWSVEALWMVTAVHQLGCDVAAHRQAHLFARTMLELEDNHCTA